MASLFLRSDQSRPVDVSDGDAGPTRGMVKEVQKMFHKHEIVAIAREW